MYKFNHIVVIQIKIYYKIKIVLVSVIRDIMLMINQFVKNVVYNNVLLVLHNITVQVALIIINYNLMDHLLFVVQLIQVTYLKTNVYNHVH
jgi:hypothetical protein